ncbi:MAG: response regulator [Anaerolineales bacterium]
MTGKGKILVLDDEAGIRRACRRALEPQGYRIETVGTIEEFSRRLDEESFDLVLLDLMLPDGRGIDLLPLLKERDEDIVCVIITGYATVELAVDAIKQGAYDFISKPFTTDQLLMTVEQGLEKRHLSLEAKRLQNIEKKAEGLLRAKQDMERLDEMKSTFMLTVAHELRAPVSSALSLLRTLLHGLSGDMNENQSEIMDRIEIRLEMLLDLINDLIELSASKTPALMEAQESIAVQPVLEKIINHFSTEAESKSISLSLQAPTDTAYVQATKNGLEKIFANLIHNAIKYTPAHGRVEIALEDTGGRVKITVADSGIGIPEDDIPRLWNEFFRAHNARASGISGTGLGLSIVKQYVEEFAGIVGVESVENEGSTFTVELPKSESPPNDHL